MCYMKKWLLFIFALLIAFPLNAGRLERGFEALNIYNYFKAKQLFERSMKRHPAGAAFGLTIIYSRADNPFSNIDSAYAFILRSEKAFATVKASEYKQLSRL